ncbi:9088_t:CDS:10 [Entrophospora sp. SA101]|nr:9088_t:CDS:10 [Entrophospora sp. SA101]
MSRFIEELEESDTTEALSTDSDDLESSDQYPESVYQESEHSESIQTAPDYSTLFESSEENSDSTDTYSDTISEKSGMGSSSEIKLPNIKTEFSSGGAQNPSRTMLKSSTKVNIVKRNTRNTSEPSSSATSTTSKKKFKFNVTEFKYDENNLKPWIVLIDDAECFDVDEFVEMTKFKNQWFLPSNNIKCYIDDLIKSSKTSSTRLLESIQSEDEILQVASLGELHQLFAKIWRKEQYDNRTDGDNTIFEPTFSHDVIDKIMFCCVQDIDKKEQAEDGNINYETHLSYDQWVNSLDNKSKSEMKQNSRRIPDCMSIIKVGSDEYEFLYNEISGPPYNIDQKKVERDRRKLIRYMRRNKEGQISKFLKNFGTSLKLLMYENQDFLSCVYTLFEVKILIESYSTIDEKRNFFLAYSMLIKIVIYAVRKFEEIEVELEKNRSIFNTNITTKLNREIYAEVDIFPSP